MKKVFFSAILIAILACGQAFAMPQLYVNGSPTPEMPVVGPGNDGIYGAWGGFESVRFTLLYELTPNASVNTLYAHDYGDFNDYFSIFDDNDVVGTVKDVFFAYGQYTFSLLNDLNDDGDFDADNNEVWLNTYRPWTLPASSDYQWFHIYDVSSYGNANFFYGNGGGDLNFSGKYYYLLFIDDDHVTSPNYDHNDMIVAMNIIPEPATLILLGLGLAGAGILRRRIR